MRIGLLGGSFDPVHRAHLALARHAQAQLQLDQLRWVPVGHAWQKARALTDSAHRVAMLELAIAGAPGQVIERCEIERAGPSYTLDTVRELQATEPGHDWLLIIGADQYAGFHTWHGFEELLQRVTLALAQRPGQRPSADARVLRAPRVDLQLPPMDIAATDIRARVAAGRAIDAMVTPEVAHYIHEHRLYTGATGS